MADPAMINDLWNAKFANNVLNHASNVLRKKINLRVYFYSKFYGKIVAHASIVLLLAQIYKYLITTFNAHRSEIENIKPFFSKVRLYETFVTKHPNI